MSSSLHQVHFRKPQPSDRAGLIVIAILMLTLIWFGITPAVVPVRDY